MVIMKGRGRLLIGILLLGLLLSLGGNYLLFLFGRSYYLQANAVRLDPIGLEIYPSVNEFDVPLSESEQRVVFLGDSRIEDWGSPDLGAGYQVVNRGIGGQTSAQVLARYEPHVAPLAPDILVVQAGINDLKMIPLFPHERELIVSRLKGNMMALVVAGTAQDGMVVLTTIFPLGEVPLERRPFWSDEVGVAIDEVNQFINSLAASQVIIFDTHSLLLDEDGMTRDSFSPDLLHLNEAGYRFLNGELAQLPLFVGEGR